MDSKLAIARLLALGQPTRLSAYRMLVEHAPDGLPVSDIAHQLGVNMSTLSRHLAQLERAGLLVTRRRERQIFYCCSGRGITELMTFLTENCCSANPARCRPADGAARKASQRRAAKRAPKPEAQS